MPGQTFTKPCDANNVLYHLPCADRVQTLDEVTLLPSEGLFVIYLKVYGVFRELLSALTWMTNGNGLEKTH